MKSQKLAFVGLQSQIPIERVAKRESSSHYWSWRPQQRKGLSMTDEAVQISITIRVAKRNRKLSRKLS